MDPRGMVALTVALVSAVVTQPAGAQDDAANEQRPSHRLGPGPTDAQPVCRPRRGGLHDLGAHLGPPLGFSPEDLLADRGDC